MFIKGVQTFTKEGKPTMTGMVAGRAGRDGELLSTRSGKSIGSVSVPAYTRQDGTTVWMTVKGWGHWADLVAGIRKGETFAAMGRVESRDYEGKTYTDLVADYVFPPISSANGPSAMPPTVSPADDWDAAEDDADLPF